MRSLPRLPVAACAIPLAHAVGRARPVDRIAQGQPKRIQNRVTFLEYPMRPLREIS